METDYAALPDLGDALRRAQALLDEDGDGYTVDRTTALPNPLQGLWVLSYLDASGGQTDGGGIVVRGDEDAYYLSSAPGQVELVGLDRPDDPDNPDGDGLTEAEEAALAAVLLEDGIDPEAFALPRSEQPTGAPAPARKRPPRTPTGGDGGVDYDGKSDTGGWDEKDHPRKKDGKGGGRFIPKKEAGKGGGEGGASDAPKDQGGRGKGKGGEDDEPKMGKAQREARLVDAILAALQDVMKDLTGPQARALIEKIKDNAHAFIEGQANGPHRGGGGGGGGGKPGGGKETPGRPTAGEDGKDRPGGKGDGGKGGAPGGGGGGVDGSVAGIVNSVRSLLKAFGDKMDPGPRRRLEKAVDELGG